MTKMPENILILGGGRSILPYISLLQPLCATNFTIACNYAYKTFKSTFLTFQDKNFYLPAHAKTDLEKNPDIYEELKTLPLIVGINRDGLEEFKLDNTILLDKKFSKPLTGILALSLAVKFNPKNIYLLGFDWDRRAGLPERNSNYNRYADFSIHFYENVKHRGIGLIGYYENHNPDNDFKDFIKTDINIYNVSLNSNIECFPKISYEDMFNKLDSMSNKLDSNIINQNELREEIRRKLCTG